MHVSIQAPQLEQNEGAMGDALKQAQLRLSHLASLLPQIKVSAFDTFMCVT